MDGISIITSAYLSDAFLKEYLDSIQNQTYFKNLVSETMKIRAKDNVVRYYFDTFFYYIPPTIWEKRTSHGVHACYKDLFFEYGGYIDWFVSADTELKNRMLKFGVKEVNPEGDMFLRRRHKNSLMNIYTAYKDRGGKLIEFENNPKQIQRITAQCREILIKEVKP
jgi:hypothetical protein